MKIGAPANLLPEAAVLVDLTDGLALLLPFLPGI